MKTIGIVTIDDYTNYGNRLQNYALTKLLEAEGFRVINGIRVNTKQDYVICSPGIIKMLDIKSNSNVIDLCCGTGDLSAIIKKFCSSETHI